MAAGEAVYKDLLVRGARRADGSITPSRSASVLWRIWICPFATGDRGFESCFLQRRVSCEPDFLDRGAENIAERDSVTHYAQL